MLDSSSFKSIIKEKKRETKTQKYNLNSNTTKRVKMMGLSYEIDKEESKNHFIVSKHNTEFFLFVTVLLL